MTSLNTSTDKVSLLKFVAAEDFNDIKADQPIEVDDYYLSKPYGNFIYWMGKRVFATLELELAGTVVGFQLPNIMLVKIENRYTNEFSSEPEVPVAN